MSDPIIDGLKKPDQVKDPIAAARDVVADPSRRDTPEWLAAMELLNEHDKAGRESKFGDLEKEMQLLKGMSEI